MLRSLLRALTPIGMVLFLWISHSFAVPCPNPVTKTSGSGPGSLPNLVSQFCSPITFDPGLSGQLIEVPFTLFMKSLTAISGNVPVTIRGAAGVSPVIVMPSNATVENVTLLNTNLDAIAIFGNNNVVNQVIIKNAARGVTVDGGINNRITQSRFTGITTNAIKLTKGGNLNLAAPVFTEALQLTVDTWLLSGTMAEGVTSLELYLADPVVPTIPQGAKYLTTVSDLGADSFSVTLDAATVPFDKAITALAFDDAGNTSPFAVTIVPQDDVNFLALVDEDDDGIMNDVDNCPNLANPDQQDDDQDEVGNVCDNCPGVVAKNTDDFDEDGLGNVCDADADNDGVFVGDNCVLTYNPNQADTDNDGSGNACDADSSYDKDVDNDGSSNTFDNCPFMTNPQQEDTDADTIGNACDEDMDNDGVSNFADNCPFAANANQDPSACGLPPSDVDTSQDDDTDNPFGSDLDGDGLADGVDNCPTVYNLAQLDADGDTLGNECDIDDDGDSILDVIEGDLDPDFDAIPNRLDLDSDGDGIADALEAQDLDGDGRPDFVQLSTAIVPAGGSCSLIVR